MPLPLTIYIKCSYQSKLMPAFDVLAYGILKPTKKTMSLSQVTKKEIIKIQVK